MAPKRVATTSNAPSAKRRRAAGGGIGAPSQADDTARLIQAHHAAEHATGGSSYLSKRALSQTGRLRSLADISLQVSAEGILETLKLPPRAPGGAASVSSVGWDKEREVASTQEATALREYVRSLPEGLATKLMGAVVELAAEAINSATDGGGISVLALATIFLHSNTTKVSFHALSAPALLVGRISACTNLVELDMSSLITLGDQALAKVLPSLPRLEKINLRGCTKVGDASVIALSKATEGRLKVANLSLTAVTVKGLVSLFARCSALEVLKLANVNGLNEKAVMKLVDDSTRAATGWRHIPLSNLRTLKLRATDVTEAALGRLLALCALSITRLDISYSGVKSLDIVSHALHTAPDWRLEKLVASGLPLTPATLKGFFEPLSTRPEEQRSRFHTLKLGSIPSTSTKAPGLTDTVLGGILPYLEMLGGLENVSFFQNWDLGKRAEPMSRFMEVIGRRCKNLDLTISLQDYHLEGLFPPLAEDGEAGNTSIDPPRLQTLILDSSKITDAAAGPISECHDLRALHVAETKISTRFLATIMASCPLLSNVNLTSCRGVPVTQRRNFFDAWAKGEVVVDEA
ncbi:hypothetical protein BCR35DRAFT_304833 [Leucosporidium creatinivorum]|uniref:RNI-like protein n=1 Tax=Leucosporidium creatinivorum TaxID=106004 RepID=A0A1Y2F4L3_9BASI|nr:hypothetical protein BCR35DRAFT_304833 [Leucosporidium creatinivorum]